MLATTLNRFSLWAHHPLTWRSLDPRHRASVRPHSVHHNPVNRKTHVPLGNQRDPMPINMREYDEFEIVLAPIDWYEDIADYEMDGISRALGISPSLQNADTTAGASSAAGGGAGAYGGSTSLFFGAAMKYVEGVTPEPPEPMKDPIAQNMTRAQMLELVK
jgi:hypothetical protein